MNTILYKTVSTIQATGRRKSSIAIVELTIGEGQFIINKQNGIDYVHKNTYLIEKMHAPLNFLKLKNEFNFKIIVKGGGLVGQVDAIKLAIARALCKYKPDYRRSLKLKGYLIRDSRIKERKKYGLKKARKAPQFSKR